MIPLSRPAKWLGYRPIDTPGTEMYHPSNGSPCTANTWGYIAVPEKQEANRAATASHGELPRLPSREGKRKVKSRRWRGASMGSSFWHGFWNKLPPAVIHNGFKAMSFTHTSLHIRVIDSFNFLPMSLSKMSGCFELSELKKSLFGKLEGKGRFLYVNVTKVMK
ncbi:hypothetical protein AVEN_87920-1 [Araneus ventricosus]|uniref:Uncharacterized protein n=1 Tax=Araneus ventricosus TaxID=182803 RepID=A0A4Y2TDS6_ARAVE|nr:hypothetical protein AVEN_87920-1 [Araneus ventricosus]